MLLWGVNIEVHELKYTQSEDVLQPGKKVSDYFVKPVEECYFLPQTPPKNTQILSENAASLIAKESFDWSTGKHAKGHIQIFLSLEYHADRNTMLPRRPKLFLSKPVKLHKGEVVQLT